ncbi:uncharacterized protein [Argopecten irradians]|uniref:uncharacterized protein n=1 Tax=Argopecten irradians TaxID=31199 RepID=UPI0037144160
MIMFVIIPITLLLLCFNGTFAVDWKSPLKIKTSDYGSVRGYCEYPMTSGGITVQLEILPGSSFDTLDCFHCECTNDGLHCDGVGVNGWSLSGPPECTVVADGCNPIFVLRANKKIDCFTRRPVGQLPNGERGYTLLGHRGSRTQPTESKRKDKQAIPVTSEKKQDSFGTTNGLPPTVTARSAAYRADTSMFRLASGDKSSIKDTANSNSFVASRLTRKWPVNRSAAYRQTQISSYPSKFKTGDRRMSKSETMVTGQNDGISEQTDPILAMIARNSANYVIDKSFGLEPRSSQLIMSRDTLIPKSDFRRSKDKIML